VGLKKRANAHLKGAVHKFKSEFSEAEQSYALGELCREILDESKSELKNLKNCGNGELPFRLGELVGEYLKGRCDAGGVAHARRVTKKVLFRPGHPAMSAATSEPWSCTFVCYWTR